MSDNDALSCSSAFFRISISSTKFALIFSSSSVCSLMSSFNGLVKLI
ncbi:hypothetical protein MCHI_001188 [Candidatus Magnetoovum chiemensis]|nr:hypothetical protein MCHI_001188 [Candidatus Magnetoovum chiemensis]